MQERISPVGNNSYPELLIQHEATHDLVGLGMEPSSDVPGLHFLDALYGGAPNQTEIGKILAGRFNELGIVIREFPTSDIEVEWYNNLGRAVLDAVGGSNSDASLWTWLDRPAVNRMIRLLRKARDNAFGRDE